MYGNKEGSGVSEWAPFSTLYVRTYSRAANNIVVQRDSTTSARLALTVINFFAIRVVVHTALKVAHTESI